MNLPGVLGRSMGGPDIRLFGIILKFGQSNASRFRTESLRVFIFCIGSKRYLYSRLPNSLAATLAQPSQGENHLRARLLNLVLSVLRRIRR